MSYVPDLAADPPSLDVAVPACNEYSTPTLTVAPAISIAGAL